MMTIEQYMALPYTMIVRWNEDDEIYVARVREIDGCTGHGATAAEALDMLQDNLREWIAFSLERGDEVPVPADKLPSGKWVQRVPRSLHKCLVECAEAEGVSLNAYVTASLARAVGRAEEKKRATLPGDLDFLHAATSLSHDYHAQRYGLYVSALGDPCHPVMHDPLSTKAVYFSGPTITKGLCSFMDTVAEQVGSHSVTHIGRIKRDSEENYKEERAYA